MFNNNLKQENEIAFILDDLTSGIEISEIIKEVFSDWQTRDTFWDEEKNVFFSLGGDKETFYPFLLNSNLVVNLLNTESDKFKEVEEKLQVTKVPRIQNSLKTISLFFNKLGTKKILEKLGIKTPVFEKLNNRSKVEVFTNFPQPAKAHHGLVEEVIKGEEIELFFFKNDEGEIFCLNSKANKEVVAEARDIFEKLNIEKFASMSFVSSPQRGLYLLDVFVDLDVLTKNEGKNLKKIKKLL